MLTTLIRCTAAVALAVILPPWLTAAPMIILSLAVAIAIIRQPNVARRALRALESLLRIPD